MATVSALGVIALGTPLAASAAQPTEPPSTFSVQPPISRAGGVVTRSAHVSFEGCSARHVILRVSIAKDPFPIGPPVTYAVSVTNNGTTSCGPSQQSIPPLHGALSVGACGVLPGVIANFAGVDVYPGKEIFSCPMLTDVHLGAHNTIRAEGSWMGDEALSAGPPAGVFRLQKAPPGRYRVIIDNAVSVPFQLAGSPAHPASPIIPAPAPAHTPPNDNLPTPTTPTTPTSKLPTPTTPTTTVG